MGHKLKMWLVFFGGCCMVSFSHARIQFSPFINPLINYTSKILEKLPGGLMYMSINNKFNGYPGKIALFASLLTISCQYGVVSDLASRFGRWFNSNYLQWLGIRFNAHPYHRAIEKDNVNAIAKLVQSKFDVNQKDEYGTTPLIYALVGNKQMCVKALLRTNADLNIPQPLSDKFPLHFAIEANNLDLTNELLEKSAYMDAPNRLGQTPLHCAVLKNNENAVKLLLEHKASINLLDWCDEKPRTALAIAQEQKNPAIAEILKRAGASTYGPKSVKFHPFIATWEKIHPEIRIFPLKR